MRNLLASLLFVPIVALANPWDIDPPRPKPVFKSEFQGFMLDLEVPVDPRELAKMRTKDFRYTLHVTKRLDLAAQALVKVEEGEGVTEFKFINFGTSFKATDRLIFGASITSLSGTFDDTSKIMMSVKYRF